MPSTASTRVNRKLSLETLLMACVGLLCAMSVLMVFSASSVRSQNLNNNTWEIAVQHGVTMAVGVFVAVLAARIPLWAWQKRVAPALLIFTFFTLVLVRVPGMPWSEGTNGAVRWIKLGPFSFQPSELAKVALILWLAKLITENRDLPPVELLKLSIKWIAPMAVLVFLGDDLGTVLLMGVVFVAMLWLGGLPTRLAGLTFGGMATLAMVSLFAFEGFRMERVKAFLNPDQYADGANYQVNQSRISYATGGITGRGPGQSRSKWGFLPEAHTDFILAVTGEELGVPGLVLTIGALAGIIAFAGMIGMRCKDSFGQLVAWGIACWFSVQACMNISTTVGAMPTKGIPLPFMSDGGSSMIVSLVAVGILISVSRSAGSKPPRARAATTSRRTGS
jgi:cell division protein FtsW